MPLIRAMVWNIQKLSWPKVQIIGMAPAIARIIVSSSAAKFAVPVPKEDGYAWSWVSWDSATKQWNTSPIGAVDLNAANLTVQQISEGWLQLTAQPTKARKE
jgi:hypothetical protein